MAEGAERKMNAASRRGQDWEGRPQPGWWDRVTGLPEPQRKMLRKAGHRWVGRKSMPGRNSRAGAGRQKWLEGTRAP